MTLEQQVCSLPLAQRLKELGVKQESCFLWRNDGVLLPTFHPSKHEYTYYSAFTVAELGEMLPRTCDLFNTPAGWAVRCYEHPSMIGQSWEEMADTEADARAKMLIHLTQHNENTQI